MVDNKKTWSSDLERVIAEALDVAGVKYEMGREPARLDFYLPDFDLYIEVKAFHSDRISEQMSRAKSVIAVQGTAAVHWLAARIKAGVVSPAE